MALIWHTLTSQFHLDKMGVVQNKALRIATGNIMKAAISHLNAEAEVLPLKDLLELCAMQY